MMRPYPKYKDSGIEWLGEIPEHWKLARLKRLANVRASNVDKLTVETQKRVLLCNYVDVYKNERITREIPFMSASATKDQIETFELKAGDVLMTKDSETPNDIGIPAYVPSELAGVVCGYHLSLIRPKCRMLFGSFLYYSLQSEFTRAYFCNEASGVTRFGLGKYSIDNTPIAEPPVEEQEAIAQFLDSETAKIDELIGKQARLIELSQEKRQALISQAVTKGLNSKVLLKDSGIDWLGAIPEHWTTPSVFARYHAVLGKMLDEKQLTGNHPIPYLRNADVNWDRINIADLPVFDIKPDEVGRFSLRTGDVLICEGGAGIGQTAIWQGELDHCAFQKALHRLRPWSNDEEPRFFYYCMRNVVETGVVLAGGTATIPHLTGEQLRKYRFPKPPLKEQKQIAEYLDRETTKIDLLIEKAKKAIELMKEHRTALISAAVTGKIDVRNAV